VATPGDGAGSGEDLVAEVVDAGDVRADDDGLVVLQGESEDGGVAVVWSLCQAMIWPLS
jgi:hypothetical protein